MKKMRYHVYLADEKDNTIEQYIAKKTEFSGDVQRYALDGAHLVNATKIYIYGYKGNETKDDEKLICSFDFNSSWVDRKWEFYRQWEW